MSDTSSPGRRRARSALAEFILIVAGVSVALGAESLWSARQDRVREAEYLEQLSRDLEENRVRLLAEIADEEMIGASAATAMQAIKSGEPVSPDSARAWGGERRGLYYSDPRLLTGTFSGLIESGDLQLIRDSDVRQAILAYLPQIAQDKAEFDRWVDVFISRFGIAREIVVGWDDYPESLAASAGMILAGDPVDPRAALVLDGQLWSNQVRLIYLRRMLEATEVTQAALTRGDEGD